jgi:response regulator RpfG family c-di-GMP phosphodiesterase
MAMTIVVIDDTLANLTLTSAMVNRIEGGRAVPFSDPSKALAFCTSTTPDLVIVDYMMPQMDGLEFIERLRKHAGLEELPILMITSETEREVRYRALELGATDFLQKPLDKVEFQARIRNALFVRRAFLAQVERSRTLSDEVTAATAVIRARELETILRLARAAEYRDPETGLHILRMAQYSVMIARHLGWTRQPLDYLLHAAPMHDVGKVGTPDQILLKPGKLTAEEFETMKEHAMIGWLILRDSSSPILQLAAEIAYTHHEKVNGSGYPRGLVGEDIPEVGRIVAVADVFDALTSVRPYKPAWSMEKAVAMLVEGRGSHFDPRCVDVFVGDLDEILAIRAAYDDGS